MIKLKEYPLGSRAIFGMITPSHDGGYGSYEFDVMSPPGVVALTSRTYVKNLDVDILKKASYYAKVEAEKLATAHANVINYIATATCFVLGHEGEKYLVNQMQEATGIACTSGGAAVCDALRFVGAKKIITFTPYQPQLAQICRDYFAEAGFEVIGEENMNFLNNVDVAAVDPLKILAHIVRLYEEHPDADAVFCVGGCFRTVGIVEDLERIIGIPVIGTQQANMWKCLQMAGIGDKMPEFGQLLGMDRL